MDHISIELTPKSKLISNHHGFRLEFNKEIRKSIEDLKEYIELKFVSWNLTNDRISYYVKEYNCFVSVRLLIIMKGRGHELTLASIYIDLNFYRNKGVVYKFANYIEKKEKGLVYDVTKEDNVVVFDDEEELKKHVDRMVKFYEECFERW